MKNGRYYDKYQWNLEKHETIHQKLIWWKYDVLMLENGKMRTVETIPGMGGGDKGEWWRGEFNYDIL
jgi:hypothetical protein